MKPQTLGDQGFARVTCPEHGTWIETLVRAYTYRAGGYDLCPRCYDEVTAGVRAAQRVNALLLIDPTETP